METPNPLHLKVNSGMNIKILFLSLFFNSAVLFSQTDPVNQLDANGKKHGVWIVWLDKDWKLAKDSMSAAYYRYNFFDHGANVYAMGPWGGKGNKLESKSSTSLKKGNAVLLDGEYNWYNANGKLASSHILKNGWYVCFKEYYKDGKLQTFFDYTKKYQGQDYSYYMCGYDENGKLKWESWERQDAKGKRIGGKGVDN